MGWSSRAAPSSQFVQGSKNSSYIDHGVSMIFQRKGAEGVPIVCTSTAGITEGIVQIHTLLPFTLFMGNLIKILPKTFTNK